MNAQPPTTDRAKSLYQRGATVAFSCKADPRFCYVLYVPEDLDDRPADAPPPRLLVGVHGTGRANIGYRDSFVEFARYNNCVVLAPLFPVGVLGDENGNGYKYIEEGDIRYDKVLLAMVEEVEAKLGLSFPKFMLFGFSGGGHFTHRFLYLHPERLSAVCIGAPGSVTLIDDSRDWWVGTRDMEARFGKALDLGAVAKVEGLVVVGAVDRETWEITHKPGSRHWMEGANDAGETRIDRATSLTASLQNAGMTVELIKVPNEAHRMEGMVPTIKAFFRKHLQKTGGLSE
ncbi:alpha/beta hydrolase family protein [Pseudooceanicola nanhaiensis]|uniref:alpha/beta hydrolase family protein n=1 Tax=Pseudooceanicola nanhaiensis TaxID=375761 RepID=UPI001CD1E10B|nr:alpha/beta hydrolase [Pseudooceanicola nanhaiensis]MCA0921415.1 alpha/beta hydrolase [Pseudooceanicola nanhaiensis]